MVRTIRVWAVLPVAIIFAAVVFRLSWNIPNSVTRDQVLWSLAIVASAVGFILLIRFLSSSIPLARLMSPRIRIGIISGLTIGLVIATVYLCQHVPASLAIISKVVLGLAVAVNASGYLLLAILVKPGLILRMPSHLFRIGVSVVMTAALTCLTIHTVRFLMSPEAVYIQSKIMAILLLASLITAYPLVLKYIWSVWRCIKRFN
jgi:hypothetical protein